ncbi:MAG: SemiSWEET family transporter [Candidatus Paceibacterota bacterium]
MRENIAKKIRWTYIIWIVSVINPFMTLPQLLKIWQTHQTSGISLVFLFILLFVQSGFSLHGFFSRDRFIMGSNGLAALMTLLTILSVLFFN